MTIFPDPVLRSVIRLKMIAPMVIITPSTGIQLAESATTPTIKLAITRPLAGAGAEGCVGVVGVVFGAIGVGVWGVSGVLLSTESPF
jgi:hypothetical protein